MNTNDGAKVQNVVVAAPASAQAWEPWVVHPAR
jgi:hypothetical protein